MLLQSDNVSSNTMTKNKFPVYTTFWMEKIPLVQIGGTTDARKKMYRFIWYTCDRWWMTHFQLLRKYKKKIYKMILSDRKIKLQKIWHLTSWWYQKLDINGFCGQQPVNIIQSVQKHKCRLLRWWTRNLGMPERFEDRNKTWFEKDIQKI